jgi:drug/metabolite transporter (DMT)-like permease
MSATTDYLKLHFLVFLWGFTAILGLLITIPAVEMVFYRTLLAALGMGALIFFSKGSFQIGTSDMVKLVLTGFIVSAHWLTFFASGKISNASVSLVGFATGSLWVALIEPLVNKRKIQVFEVMLGCLVVVGLYIIFSFNFKYPMGLILGMASGLTMAVFSVINSHLVKRINPNTITFYEMTSACMATALFLPFYKVTWATNYSLHLDPTLSDWLYLCVLALVCTVYAYSAGVELMKRMSVFIIQLTLNLEPVYGIIMAVIIFGDSEKMQPSFYIGTLIIISSVFSYPLFKTRFARNL